MQAKHLFLTTTESRAKFLLTIPRQCFFCGSFLLFMFCVCHAILSFHCSLVVNCLEMAYLLALLCVMFSFVFVTFPCGVLGQVWFLIVSIPYLSLLPYFGTSKMQLCTQSLRLLSVLMWWLC